MALQAMGTQQVDIHDASVATLFLLAKVNLRLRRSC